MNEKKPAQRWWIPILAEEEELVREVQQNAEAGFGLLEICLSTSDTNVSEAYAAQNGWGTKAWNDKYKAILRAANDVGIQIDTTASPMYPPGVPTITKADPAASKEIRICSTEPFTGTYCGALPENTEDPRKDFIGQVNQREFCDFLAFTRDDGLHEDASLVAVVAARVDGETVVSRIQGASWGDDVPNFNEKHKRTTLLGEPVVLDIIPQRGEVFHWTAPDQGTWKIFAAWSQGTGQTAGHGAISWAPCVVVDHFSLAGVQALIDFWEKYLLDDELLALIRENGSSVFEDSIELHVTKHTNLWTPDFLSEFQKRRGYDFTPYLPLLVGLNHRGDSVGDLFNYELADDPDWHRGGNIRNDFRQTMNDLLLEYHTIPFQNWLHEKGYQYRAQMYSAILDTGYASALVDQPEGESIGFGWGVHAEDRFRLVSGGAHMGLRQQISDEAGAMFGQGYRQSWLDFLEIANRGFAGGANLMMFHGFPYRNSNQSVWPGLHPFGISCAGSWGPREPGWAHITDLTGYLTRVQTLLSAGRPRVDVALLQYYYGTSAPFLADQSMMEAGYSYDIITPQLLALPSAEYAQGRLCPEGAGYRAVVLYRQNVMPLDGMERIYALATKGLPLVIVGAAPSVAAFSAEDDTSVQEISERLTKLPNVVVIPEPTLLPDTLIRLGVPAAAAFDHPARVHATCRADDEKTVYHLWNATNEDVALNVRFAGTGSLVQYDPWTEQRTVLTDDNESYAAPIKLSPREAQVYLIESNRHTVPVRDAEQVCEIKVDTWALTVESWQDASDPVETWHTKKTDIHIPAHHAASWRTVPELGDAVSGIGRYSGEFTLHQPVSNAQVELPLKDFSSVRLWVNDNPVPVNLYTTTAMLTGELLKVGTNSIRLEITSQLFNRLDADGAFSMPFGPPPEMDMPEAPGGDMPPMEDGPMPMMAENPPQDYGLVGPVKIKTTR